LIIIPAATAKQAAGGLNSMLVIAPIVALIATLGGSALASHLHKRNGPSYRHSRRRNFPAESPVSAQLNRSVLEVHVGGTCQPNLA
jgi:hypothetical protein